MKRILILGGGFSGTVTAVNLARLSLVPLQISVVDRSSAPCRGIAYSASCSSHLLNVAARNMSALADQPQHFIDWLATRSEFLGRSFSELQMTFAPRAVYGDYLHNLFQWHATSAPSGTRLERVSDEVIDLTVQDQEAVAVFGSGRTLSADKVILATGNQIPGALRVPGWDARDPRYIGNPWAGLKEGLPTPDKDILLIGTGLTMVDTFLTLQDLGWRGKITAASRHGLLPLSHFKGSEYPDFLEAESSPPLRRLLSIFQQHARIIRSRKMNPAILVDKLRPHTQRLWQNFSTFEKRQFIRHLRTRWNVARHRLPPDIHRKVSEALSQGQLEILKGRLAACSGTGDELSLTLKTGLTTTIVRAAVVINCSGPRESYSSSGSDLFGRLNSHGLIQPDELNMGIKAASNFSVIDREDRESTILYALGPLLKGTLWETTAVPELRSQAFRIVESIVSQLPETYDKRSSISEVVEDVIEYFI